MLGPRGAWDPETWSRDWRPKLQGLGVGTPQWGSSGLTPGPRCPTQSHSGWTAKEHTSQLPWPEETVCEGRGSGLDLPAWGWQPLTLPRARGEGDSFPVFALMEPLPGGS